MKLLKALFRRKPKRHYPANWPNPSFGRCNCGYSSPWDPQLRRHFEEVGK